MLLGSLLPIALCKAKAQLICKQTQSMKIQLYKFRRVYFSSGYIWINGRREPIKMVVDSLIYFMKSLPPNSKFNIYLFDSTHNSYYPNSVEYNEVNASQSLKRIREEKFRFGGTEIYQPLEAIL